jgi:hypothetical protein
MGITEYYTDPKNCYADILAARKAWGVTTITPKEFDGLEKGLGLLYLNCPKDLQALALATLDEATIRRTHFEVRIWNT